MIDIKEVMKSEDLLQALTGFDLTGFNVLLPVFGKTIQKTNSRNELFFILFYVKHYPTFQVGASLFEVSAPTIFKWKSKFLPALEAALGRQIILPVGKTKSVDKLVRSIPNLSQVIIDKIILQDKEMSKGKAGRRETRIEKQERVSRYVQNVLREGVITKEEMWNTREAMRQEYAREVRELNGNGILPKALDKNSVTFEIYMDIDGIAGGHIGIGDEVYILQVISMDIIEYLAASCNGVFPNYDEIKSGNIILSVDDIPLAWHKIKAYYVKLRLHSRMFPVSERIDGLFAIFNEYDKHREKAHKSYEKKLKNIDEWMDEKLVSFDIHEAVEAE